MGSILRVCSASLLTPICDVNPQLISEKQIKFCKLNSPAFPLAQGVSRTCPLLLAPFPQSQALTILHKLQSVACAFSGRLSLWSLTLASPCSSSV